MTLPVRRRPGSLLERSFPGFGRGEPVAAEFDELFERMSRLLEGAATAPAALAWSPAGTAHHGGVRLPADLKPDEVSATLHDGVLTATVPKAQATKERHIEITES